MPQAIRLPRPDHPARLAVDDGELVAMLAPERRFKLPMLRRALANARAYFAAEPAARAIHSVCWFADDNIRLIRIGRRGGYRVLWTYTHPWPTS